MPSAVIDGITTEYEVTGSGPPLLMFSPGGFDARLANWTSHGRYAQLRLLEHLPRRYTCITFDRRESGSSGGRVERIGWAQYVAQGVGLLDRLGIERAHLLSGCVGCSTAVAFAVAHPDRVLSMVLFSPAGGPRYRLMQQARFAAHASYVDSGGLAAVVALAHSHGLSFSGDPRGGPWVQVIRADDEFAKAYEQRDRAAYLTLLGGMSRLLFDRDTVSGAEPEDLMQLDLPALVVPGQDASHATSAARYLQECLPRSDYWDVPVVEQTEQATADRLLSFLANAR